MTSVLCLPPSKEKTHPAAQLFPAQPRKMPRLPAELKRAAVPEGKTKTKNRRVRGPWQQMCCFSSDQEVGASVSKREVFDEREVGRP